MEQVFSVIIPTYNRPGRLRDCLESMARLSYPGECFEVIVVDDGSVDGTREVVEALTRRAGQRVRLVRSGPDVLAPWVCSLIERRGYNKAVVALANKLARIGWAVVARGQAYQAVPA